MEKLRYYLQWWFEYKLPRFIPRIVKNNILNFPLIPVLVGPRRSGKSTLFFQLIAELRKTVPPLNIIYMNYEDDRLAPLDGRELSELLNIYRQMYHPVQDYPIYLFLDEVQNVPQWDQTVRRIYETESSVRLYLTGSNSKMLSREIATTLRGRTISQQIFPLSFKEYLLFHNIQIPDIQNFQYSPRKDRLLFAFENYLKYGGFPEVVLTKDDQIKERILKEYLNTIFFRDIVERYAIRNYKTMDILIKILTRHMAAMFSFGKLRDSLKSIGLSISKNTLIEYLSYIEEAFLGSSVSIYSYSIKDQFQYPRKFYLVDDGLYQASSFLKSEDYGRLLENLVYNTLKRIHENIYYWKDRNGYEVDFVLPDLFDNKEAFPLIQVCYSLDNEDIVKREVRALVKASREFKINRGLIITRDRWDEWEKDGVVIKVVPFIHWVLEGESGEVR